MSVGLPPECLAVLHTAIAFALVVAVPYDRWVQALHALATVAWVANATWLELGLR